MANAKISNVVSYFDKNPVVTWGFGLAILALIYVFNKKLGYYIAWLSWVVLLVQRV